MHQTAIFQNAVFSQVANSDESRRLQLGSSNSELQKRHAHCEGDESRSD
jgi:hypothetical protein